jgi:hypothetical protein
MALCRISFLTAYLSEQLIAGFTTGGATHVMISQLNKILGVPMPRREGFGMLFFVRVSSKPHMPKGSQRLPSYGAARGPRNTESNTTRELKICEITQHDHFGFSCSDSHSSIC